MKYCVLSTDSELELFDTVTQAVEFLGGEVGQIYELVPVKIHPKVKYLDGQKDFLSLKS